MHRSLHLLYFVAVFAGFALLLGCSEQGPKRYHLSGTVVYQGKPLPMGTMFLTPDFSQQSSGLQGYTNIVAGKFDTRQQGNGHSGGPMLIQISGADAEGSRVLFTDVVVKLDLPKADSVQEIVVPDGM